MTPPAIRGFAEATENYSKRLIFNGVLGLALVPRFGPE
jgi:hypothetical protein